MYRDHFPGRHQAIHNALDRADALRRQAQALPLDPSGADREFKTLMMLSLRAADEARWLLDHTHD